LRLGEIEFFLRPPLVMPGLLRLRRRILLGISIDFFQIRLDIPLVKMGKWVNFETGFSAHSQPFHRDSDVQQTGNRS
jgi:hypothetical protein